MALVGALGGLLERYGVDGEDLGWVEGTFTPTDLSCNPHGAVQAGVHTVLLDAAMNFAINAALAPGDVAQATVSISTELLRGATKESTYLVRGEVVRLTRQIAHAEAQITNEVGEIVSRSTGTFLLRRQTVGS